MNYIYLYYYIYIYLYFFEIFFNTLFWESNSISMGGGDQFTPWLITQPLDATLNTFVFLRKPFKKTSLKGVILTLKQQIDKI